MLDHSNHFDNQHETLFDAADNPEDGEEYRFSLDEVLAGGAALQQFFSDEEVV